MADCLCEAPHLNFEFRAGGKTIRNDEQYEVVMEPGEVSLAARQQIKDLIFRQGANYATVEKHLDSWAVVTRGGKLAKRIERITYKYCGFKLDPAVVTEIGNIASRHSTLGKSHLITLTRNFNAPATEWRAWYSCFWSYNSWARCVMKQNGMLGMRSFRDGVVNGRMFICPLGEDMQPTHDTMGAVAFACFNPHDGLAESVGATVLAQMLGWQHKKLGNGSEWDSKGLLFEYPEGRLPEYSGSHWLFYSDYGQGYVVGPKAVIDPITNLKLTVTRQHEQVLAAQAA